ncbi:hypothetical protein V6N13_095658 [Hibiscus sabdariffa]
MNDSLLSPFTVEDVRYAVFNMAPLKAPGVDSYPVCSTRKGLSTLLNDAHSRGTVKGVSVGRSRLQVGHLLFADDSILFGEASAMNATSVKSLLTLYGNASGQRVNFDKYLIYFISNVDTDCKDLIASMLGVRISSNPEKYLGLPTMVGRSKKEAFSYFYDRFNAKVNSWGCGVCLWVVKRPTAVPRWEAPYLSVVKINFDSAFNLQDRSAMSGAVVRNNEGLILAPCVVPHSNVSNTFVAEALACKNVVQVAKDMRFFEVIIEGDSLTVVKKLNSTIQDSFIISPIIVDIKDLAKSFHSISFRFVRRGENKVAHSLARESRLVQGSHF